MKIAKTKSIVPVHMLNSKKEADKIFGNLAQLSREISGGSPEVSPRLLLFIFRSRRRPRSYDAVLTYQAIHYACAYIHTYIHPSIHTYIHTYISIHRD